MEMSMLKVALIHEWLTIIAGSEKVVRRINNIYNDSDVFALVNFLNTKQQKNLIGEKKITTSIIQRLPFTRNHFRMYLPIFPLAVRLFRLKKYNILLTSSHAFANGIRSKKNQLHISYCHTPMRYIWDLQDLYLEANNMNKGLLSIGSNLLAMILRKWDYKCSKNVTHFIANSNFTADRIKRCYNRDAKVIYPPVNINNFSLETNKSDYYLTAGRLVCYKKADLIVKAFAKMPDKKLIVIGDGKFKDDLVKMATPNIQFFSHLNSKEFTDYMQKAKAFVFAGEEDFGITMVEAQACGTPVIAYNKGGASEIVIDNETGVLYNEQSDENLIEAIGRFEQIANTFDSKKIRQNSLKFSEEVFDKEYKTFVDNCINETFK